ncbi:MAG: flagellar hook capping FlgD N-terminal domain-containing protein [Halieaceae bacterium]|jgi:flagellar basal-body rod modification protein FlgD|nr:flagellar hook capping FlgD N-terminal domain-containing protein [Halieaceae bacterium]
MTIDAASFQSRQDIFASLNPAESTQANSKPTTVEEMGSDQFLALMIAQLENQDPTKPMDGMAMMSQLAQFGVVGGVQELNESFASMNATMTGTQAMQAANMVGRAVATDSNIGTTMYLGRTADGEAVYGLQASANMGAESQGGTYYIQDAAGQLVATGPIRSGGGTQLIQWDGRNSEGEQLPPGQYSISAESFFGGASRPVTVSAHEQVVSVSVGGNGDVTLNLTNGQSMPVDRVTEFF